MYYRNCQQDSILSKSIQKDGHDAAKKANKAYEMLLVLAKKKVAQDKVEQERQDIEAYLNVAAEKAERAVNEAKEVNSLSLFSAKKKVARDKREQAKQDAYQASLRVAAEEKMAWEEEQHINTCKNSSQEQPIADLANVGHRNLHLHDQRINKAIEDEDFVFFQQEMKEVEAAYEVLFI